MSPCKENHQALVAQFRSIVQWVSDRDRVLAIDLDTVVHHLETCALSECATRLEAVRRERDAAWMDLQRIRQILEVTLRLSSQETEVAIDSVDPVIRQIVSEK